MDKLKNALKKVSNYAQRKVTMTFVLFSISVVSLCLEKIWYDKDVPEMPDVLNNCFK